MNVRADQESKSLFRIHRISPRLACLLLLGSSCLTQTGFGGAIPHPPIVPPKPIHEAGLSPEAEKGETLFNTHCIVCHQAGAKGQVGFAPSIRNRDFLALASDEFIRKTIRQGRMGTAMVARADLTDEEVEALIAYLRSLHPANPIQVKVDWTKKTHGDAQAGEVKYQVFCASCHGPTGDGYVSGGAGTGIGLPGFWEVASDDYVIQTLKLGRIGTPMKPFAGARGLANLSERDMHDIIAHLKNLAASFGERINLVTRAADPRIGEIQFTVNCSPCHQVGGVGKVGFAPSIRNRDFLALASDDFIRKTVRNGRPGTGMVARPDLPEQTLLDIISYLRALPVSNPVKFVVDPTKKITGDADIGEAYFGVYCAACHGPTGEGYSVGGAGPAIGYPGFLQAASDDYILQTLKHGRVGTPMKPFIGAMGLANLREQEAYNIIAYLRSMEDRDLTAASSANIFE